MEEEKKELRWVRFIQRDPSTHPLKEGRYFGKLLWNDGRWVKVVLTFEELNGDKVMSDAKSMIYSKNSAIKKVLWLKEELDEAD